MLNVIRNILGNILIFINFITRPKRIIRSEEEQKKVDEQTSHLSLYQFNACPFCIRVRRAFHRLNLNIELRDAKGNLEFRNELEKEGGKIKAPCLRIDENGQVKWLYESLDIIKYLESRFLTS